MTLTREEQETFFSQTAQDRIDGVWTAYTDDPVWRRRLDALVEAVGADNVTIEEGTHGGRTYHFDENIASASIRRKRKLTDEQRARLSKNSFKSANAHSTARFSAQN